MFRVCLISSYPPSRGRLSEYAYSLISELQTCPEIAHIDVITDAKSHRSIRKINGKITLHRIWRPDNLISMLYILFKILKLKPDIVHFNVHMAVFGHSRLTNFVGLSLPFFCKMVGLKTVVTLHNMTERIDIEKAGFQDSLLNRVGAFLATKLLSQSSVLTVTVKSYVELLKMKYKCRKVVWIPHGAWKSSYNSFHSKSKPRMVLYIGHSGPHKDLGLLFEAFQILNPKRNGVKLVVAGSSHPNYPDFLEKIRSENSLPEVQFVGHIPDDELPFLFEKADVVVLPYHTCTGTSGVAHLASSFGVPIVATDLPEFKELLEDGCGMILSSHDPRVLSQKMGCVLNDDKLAAKLREQNLRFASKRTWDKIALQFCEAYRTLFHKSAR